MNTTEKDDAGFARLLLTSFQYPFGGDGFYLIISGSVVFTVADFVSAYASIAGILIQVGITGYLAAYAKDVVRTSAMGEDALPGWVDFSDWVDDVVVPAFQFLIIIALSFGLIIFFQFKHPSQGQVGKILWLVAGAWGCLTLPILFLAVAVTDSTLSLLNPIPLVRAVWLTLPNYLLVCLLCALIVGLGVGASILENFARHIPILPHLLAWLASLYLITVLMRSFGLLYCYHHDRLQWY